MPRSSYEQLSNAGQPAAEVVEERGLAKGRWPAKRVLDAVPGKAPSALDRVRQAARRDKKARFEGMTDELVAWQTERLLEL